MIQSSYKTTLFPVPQQTMYKEVYKQLIPETRAISEGFWSLYHREVLFFKVIK